MIKSDQLWLSPISFMQFLFFKINFDQFEKVLISYQQFLSWSIIIDRDQFLLGMLDSEQP